MGRLLAVYGGGFKPPTVGHFEVVKKTLDKFPEIEEFIIYVGEKERDNINQAQSILIWEIFQTYLPMKVQIQPSKGPIGDIIRLGKNNPQDEIYFVIGSREGDEDDAAELSRRSKGIEEKYPNMKIKLITNPNTGVSGTNARKASQVSYNDFIKYLPSELSDSEKEEVYNIVKPSIKETDNPDDGKSSPYGSGYKKLNENASYSKDIDVKGKIMQLTQHMLDKGYNIEPLPTVEFVDGDSDNARDFLGKTAYYNPNNNTITLYTEGRHPKDIVRSFAHEMIHHIQNLENRLGDIGGTNTMEDDHLNDIEAEANLKGTMTFRNWTDSLDENIFKKSLDQTKKYTLKTGETITLKVDKFMLSYGSLNITAFDKDDNKIGAAYFTSDETNNPKILSSSDTSVKPNWWRKGVGTVMYDFAKTFKYKIIPSKEQTPDGKKFTDNLNEIGADTEWIDFEGGTLTLQNVLDLTKNIPQKNYPTEKLSKIVLNWDDNPTEIERIAQVEVSNQYPILIMADEDGSILWILDGNHRAQKALRSKAKTIPAKIIKPSDLDDNARKVLGVVARGKSLNEKYNYACKCVTGLDDVGNLKEVMQSVTDGMVVVLSREDNALDLYDTVTKESLGHINVYQNEVTGVAAKKGYGPLMYELGMAYVYPKPLRSDRNGNTEQEAQTVWEKFIEGINPNIKVVKLTPRDEKFATHFPNESEIWEPENNFYNYEFYNPNKSQVDKLITKGSLLTKEEQEHIIKVGSEFYHKLVRENEHTSTLNKDPFGLNAYARGLTTGLEEAIVGDKIECDNCDWSWDIKDGGDDLYICHKCGYNNTPLDEGFDKKLGKDPFGLNQFAREIAEEVINEGRYDTLTNKLSSITFKAFKDIYGRGDKEGSFKFRVDHPEDEHDIPSKDFFFDFEGYVEITDDEYKVDGGANAGFDDEGDEITPLLSVKFKIPKNPDWQKISFDIKDVVRHELEHLTQEGYNQHSGKYMEDDTLVRDLIDAEMLPKSQYFKLEKEVDAMLQGLYFKAKKSKLPFKDVIDDYLDIFVNQETITQEEKNIILDIWRSRGKSLSLPLFEQDKDMDYEIYSDMDGVLTDFDASFIELSNGVLPSEYQKNFSRKGFWDLINSSGVGYWVKMPWMSDGKEYWDYIKKYNPILLSSPSSSPTSRLGKRLWVKNNLPGTKLILAQAKDKQNYAQKNRILIDDRPSNIDQWRSQNGIGILHITASDTIRQLKELGL